MLSLRILMLLSFLAVLAGAGRSAPQRYPDRWFYASRSLSQDQDVADLEALVNTAADHGLNGLLLASRFDTLDLAPADFFPRLEHLKATCRRRGVEIIPCLFSAGYGGGILAHDRNLAAGLPVVDAPFVVRGGEARPAPDPDVQVVNGGLEEWTGTRPNGYALADRPGEISVPDREVFKEGKTSLRLQRFGELDAKNGHARLMQEITVKPRRHYQVSAWVRTEGLQPASAFRVQVYAGDHVLAPADVGVPATTEWRQISMGFNSGENEKLRLYLGLWGGQAGTVWIDDLRVEDAGLTDVLRRPGTPLSVRSADGATTYEEGKDFAPVEDPELLRAHKDPAGPGIRIPAGSRIREGEKLIVSFYHGQAVNRSQVSACMSEPKVYDIWREQARLVQQYLAPKKWFLSMDEIRAGGSCKACKDRKMTMGEILGDCITRQVQVIREASPGAEVYCWSDMLDPGHNGHGDYYLVDGDYAGSWEHVPKDLIIACWWYQERERSLRFFAERGFRTIGGAYYDGDDLENCKGWLEALAQTPKAQGIIYTSWRSKYALLGPFGDLVGGK